MPYVKGTRERWPISIRRDKTPTSSLVLEYFVTLGRVPTYDPFLQVWLGFREGRKWWLRLGFWRDRQANEWRVDLGPITVIYNGRRW